MQSTILYFVDLCILKYSQKLFQDLSSFGNFKCCLIMEDALCRYNEHDSLIAHVKAFVQKRPASAKTTYHVFAM